MHLDAAAIIGLGQFVLALLIWFGLDVKTIGRRFAMLELTRSKVLLLLILGGTAFSSYALYRASHRQLTISPLAMAITAWGSEPPFCQVTINPAPLESFKDKYALAIACGFEDATTDKMEDKKITVSPLFSIRPDAFSITVAYRKDMMEELERRKVEASKAVKPGTRVFIGATWYEVLLLPKGADPNNIQKLSDVNRYGGKLLSQAPTP